jgi:hypothetical protein
MSASAEREDRAWPLWPLVALATLAGAIARAAPVLGAGFPINDGGLFAWVVDDILRTGELVPAALGYNGLDGPFAYPPLAFIVAAFLEALAGIGTTEWLRWIPLVASIATVSVTAFLAVELTPTRVHAAVATFAFALVPRSFEWLVMGGGLTRAPGLLLALVAAWFGLRFLRHGGRAWVGAGITLGLAVLTHPQAGLFAAVTLALATVAYARTTRAWGRMLAAAGVGVLVASPWLLLVVSRHGLAPLLSAGSTGPNLLQSLLYVLTANLTDEPFWRLGAALAVLGLVYALATRRWFVPAWIATLLFIDPRGAVTLVTAPVAILVAVGLLDVVVARLACVGGELWAVPGWPDAVLRRTSTRAVLGGSLVLGLVAALLAPYVLSSMATLEADQRDAMAWSRAELPPGSRVVVVTGREWYEDATSEWFPYLADQVSVATVQGYEWLGADAWQRQRDLAADLAERATSTVDALDEWARIWGVAYDVVYLPKGPLGAAGSPDDCCSAMRATLREATAYEIVYDGAGATIARRLVP